MKTTSIFCLCVMIVCASFGLFSAGCAKPEPVPAPDYTIVCGMDTLIIMDQSDTVAKIPYSDSSDLWSAIMADNR